MSPYAVEHHRAAGPPLGRGESDAERRARHDARTRLLERVGERVGADDALWLADCLDAVADGDPSHDPRPFDLALALVPARLGGEPLERGGVTAACPADDASAPLLERDRRTRVDDAARALLVTAAGDATAPALLARGLRTGDAATRLGLYRSLPLLPHDDAIVALVRPILRRGPRDAFEAIAHDNPWPARHLRDPDWHRLVLGALALGSALSPIVGLERRADAALATRLFGHARACRADGRPVPVELWDALGSCATREALAPFLPGGGAIDAPWPDDATHAALARAVVRSRDPALAALGRRRTRPRARLVGLPSPRRASSRRG